MQTLKFVDILAYTKQLLVFKTEIETKKFLLTGFFYA